MLGYTALCSWSAVVLASGWPDAVRSEIPHAAALLGLHGGLLALSAILGWRLWPQRPTRVAAVRGLLCCAAFGCAVATAAQLAIPADAARWPTRASYFAGLAGAQIVWVYYWRRRADRSAARPVGRLDLIGANVLLAAAALEIGLTLFAIVRPSPLVFRDSVADHLRAMRQPPGAAFFDGHLNSAGYADEEFFRAGPDDLVVAVLADSFGLGIVPLRENFVSVAEAALRSELGARFERVALHNYGVPAIGPAEYAHLLATEVPRSNPALVVVCVFVGNDIHEGIGFTKGVRERYRFQDWLLWRVTGRVVAFAGAAPLERRRLARITVARSATEPPAPAVALPERPTMSEERFARIETRRARVSDPSDPKVARGYGQLFAALRYFERALADRLLVVVIPDEFQVNDELWQAVAGARTDLERGMPQRRIAEFCDSHEIALLDLLPALRDAEAAGHTYHLRDTHWNARGNRVAGEELARAIGRWLTRRSRNRGAA